MISAAIRHAADYQGKTEGVALAIEGNSFLASAYDGQIHEVSSHLHDEPAPAQALHAQDELFMNLALEASRQVLRHVCPIHRSTA